MHLKYFLFSITFLLCVTVTSAQNQYAFYFDHYIKNVFELTSKRHNELFNHPTWKKWSEDNQSPVAYIDHLQRFDSILHHDTLPPHLFSPALLTLYTLYDIREASAQAKKCFEDAVNFDVQRKDDYIPLFIWKNMRSLEKHYPQNSPYLTEILAQYTQKMPSNHPFIVPLKFTLTEYYLENDKSGKKFNRALHDLHKYRKIIKKDTLSRAIYNFFVGKKLLRNYRKKKVWNFIYKKHENLEYARFNKAFGLLILLNGVNNNSREKSWNHIMNDTRELYTGLYYGRKHFHSKAKRFELDTNNVKLLHQFQGRYLFMYNETNQLEHAQYNLTLLNAIMQKLAEKDKNASFMGWYAHLFSYANTTKYSIHNYLKNISPKDSNYHYIQKYFDARKVFYQHLHHKDSGNYLLQLSVAEFAAISHNRIKKTPTEIAEFRQLVPFSKYQQALADTEALVTICQYYDYDMDKHFTLTDSVKYVAYILTNKGEPIRIQLPSGKELNDSLDNYDISWKKIDYSLPKNTKKIYYVPDGLYQNLNPSTLQITENQYVLHKYAIIQLIHPDNILNKAPAIPNKEFVSFANPNAKNKKNNALSKKTILDSLHYFYGSTINLPDGNYQSLQLAELEADTIEHLLQKKGWRISSYRGENATEENAKSIRSPQVLLFATHGEQRDDNSFQRSLTNSFLVMTGASNETKSGEDGVFTAFEIANLRLDSTQLVILDACKTGLGTPKLHEGSYGLTRTFLLAGAHHILSSLDTIEASSSPEFMYTFMDNWQNKHLSIDNAFYQTQLALFETNSGINVWGNYIFISKYK